MKKILLLILALTSSAYAELAAQGRYVFPFNPESSKWNDTMLNKKEIVGRERIRRIDVYKNAPEGRRGAVLDNTKYYDELGRLTAVLSYLPRKGTDSVICLADSVIYNDATGETLLLCGILGNKQPYLTTRTERLNDSVIKETTVGTFAGPGLTEPKLDSHFCYTYFNKKGQKIRKFFDYGNGSTTEYYKYNQEGIIDSVISYDDAMSKIFNRPSIEVYKEFWRKGLRIMQNVNWFCVNKWIYNERWECIEHWSAGHKDPSMDVKVYYSYTNEGLLDEVKVKRGNKDRIRYYYSYSRE